MKYNDHIHYYNCTKLGSQLYVIKGSAGQYMIDAGINTRIIRKKYTEMVAEGIDFTQTQGILLTHSHQDHIRGIPFWVEKSGYALPVYVAEYGMDVIRDEKKVFMGRLEKALGPFYKQISHIPQKAGLYVTSKLWGPIFDMRMSRRWRIIRSLI